MVKLKVKTERNAILTRNRGEVTVQCCMNQQIVRTTVLDCAQTAQPQRRLTSTKSDPGSNPDFRINQEFGSGCLPDRF